MRWGGQDGSEPSRATQGGRQVYRTAMTEVRVQVLSPEWVAAIAASAALIIGLVQLQLQRMDQRKRERAAYSAIWAEHFRVWAKSQQWKDTDIVKRVRDRTIDPLEIRPQAWDALLPLLGELGPEGAHYAGLAAMRAEDASLMVALMVRQAENEAQLAMSDLPGQVIGARLEVIEQQLNANADRARREAGRAADLFQDAINVSPLAQRQERFHVIGGASEDARSFIELLKRREAGLRRTRIQSIRHRLSIALIRLSERIDAGGKQPLPNNPTPGGTPDAPKHE